MESINELAEFLRVPTRLDVKQLAIHHVLSMTGHFESRKLLLGHEELVRNTVILAFRPGEQKSIAKDAFFTLINLSAHEVDAKQLIDKCPTLPKRLIEYVLDENSPFSDTACAVLSNLSRGIKNSQTINKTFDSDKTNNEKKTEITLEKLLKVFCTENFNKTNKLDYLAPFICNLTQLEEVRAEILSDDLLILRLLPYTTYAKSIIRRGGIVGAIKNFCFDYEVHEKLLFSKEIDLLSRLLLPLAGPEEFDADDMDKLPEDLQYLPPDKAREEDPDVRNMLIETIMMLCSKKKCRKYIKDKNTYVIMRELFNWESDEKVKATCEKVIQVLIGDEPETGMEDLHQVAVPEELSSKFYEYETKELEKNFN